MRRALGGCHLGWHERREHLPAAPHVVAHLREERVDTIESHRGAQVFEALGLSQTLVDEYFTATSSRLGGVGLDVLAEEVARRHRLAYPLEGQERAHRRLETG